MFSHQTVESLLALIVPGWTMTDMLMACVPVIAVGAVGFLLSFFYRDRVISRSGRLFTGLLALLFVLVLVVGVAGTALSTLAGLQQCVSTRGTATFQFDDDAAPQAASIVVARCRERAVGDQTFGPWQKAYVQRMQ